MQDVAFAAFLVIDHKLHRDPGAAGPFRIDRRLGHSQPCRGDMSRLLPSLAIRPWFLHPIITKPVAAERV